MHYRPPPYCCTNQRSHTPTDIQYSRVTGYNNLSHNPQIVSFLSHPAFHSQRKKETLTLRHARDQRPTTGFWQLPKKIRRKKREKDRKKKKKTNYLANDDQILLNVDLFISTRRASENSVSSLARHPRRRRRRSFSPFYF